MTVLFSPRENSQLDVYMSKNNDLNNYIHDVNQPQTTSVRQIRRLRRSTLLDEIHDNGFTKLESWDLSDNESSMTIAKRVEKTNEKHDAESFFLEREEG